MTTTPDQWGMKFLREHPFIAFGSLMNAYGNMNHGKGCNISELEVVADRLFSKAIELAKRAYDETTPEEEEGVDIPLKGL